MNLMKSMIIQFDRVLKTASVAFIFVAFLSAGCKKDSATPTNASYNISGNANGSQVVPAVSGSGTGTITGTYNPNTRLLTYTSNWSGLTGAPSSGGFYTGASGSSGTAMGTPWTIASGSTGTGTTTGTMTLTEAQASSLMNGNVYYSYGTAANPGGEVRGQVTASKQ
jgi:hypothetical protein